jgi:hypothetical protein
LEIEYDAVWQSDGNLYGNLVVILCTMAFWCSAKRKNKRINFASYGKFGSTSIVVKNKSQLSVGHYYSKIFFVDLIGPGISDY